MVSQVILFRAIYSKITQFMLNQSLVLSFMSYKENDVIISYDIIDFKHPISCQNEGKNIYYCSRHQPSNVVQYSLDQHCI